MAFNNWPFTNFQDLNLNWILQKVGEAAAQAAQAATTVAGYAARLLNIENSDSTQNARISALETRNGQQDSELNTLRTGVSNNSRAIGTLEQYSVRVTVQDFDDAEKIIARDNIGAGTSTVTYDEETNAIIIKDVPTGNRDTVPVSGGGGSADAVLYVQQSLTTAQKTQARQNIGAGKSTVSYNENTGVLSITDADAGVPTAYPVPSDTVRYGAAQNLTEAQKARARQNIGAGTGTVENAVLFTAQTLTEGQKTQARTNIGAGTTTTRVNVSDGTITITDPYMGSGQPLTYQYKTVFLIVAEYSNGEYTFNRNQEDILSAIVKGQLPVVRHHTTAGQSDYDVYHEWVFDYYTYDGEDVYIFFDRVDQYGNISQMKWYGSTGKAVVVESATVPKATSADNGKIPMVNSFGNYQLVTPSVSSGTPKISMANTDTTPALDANKFYVFPEMASLSVSLNTPASNAIVNEFHFRFTSGSTATQFDLPATVNIPDDFDVAADTLYEISIIDNYMVYSSWAVSAA